MKKYIIILAIAVVGIIYGCDDFLEMDKNGQISQDEFYNSDEYATQSIYAAYDLLQQMYGPDWTSIWAVKSILSGELNAGGGSSTDQPGYQSLSSYTHDASNEHILGIYSNLYACINRCNTVITNIEGDSDLKKEILAEAKVIRAYCYFELVIMFKNVPLVLEELEANAQPSPAEPSEIWAQIEEDLNEAITVLPEEILDYKRWRVSIGTARGLLGKVLIYQEKFEKAIDPLEALIKSGQFELNSDYSQVLRKGSEFGHESLLEVSYSDDNIKTGMDFPWDENRQQETNVTWQLCGPRDCNMGNTGINNGWGFGTPRKETWDAFINAGDIVRRKARIMSEEELEAAGGSFSKNEDGSYVAWQVEGFIRLAYTTYIDETNAANLEYNYGTNFRVLRYADVLLLAAEAYEETGDDGNAAKYLNMVRSRVNFPDYNLATDGTLDEAIFSERQREFMFEGQRWSDVIRKGKGVELFGNFGFVAGKNELLPIPKQEMDVNPNMVQNPGW